MTGCVDVLQNYRPATSRVRARSLGGLTPWTMARSKCLPTVTAKGATIPDLAEEYEVGIGNIWRALQPVTKRVSDYVDLCHRDCDGAKKTGKKKKDVVFADTQ